MGILSDFMGGAGDAAAFWGKQEIIKRGAMERDEANSARESSLRRGLQDDRQEFETTERTGKQAFETSEREAGAVTTAEQNKLQRQSTERVANTRTKGERADKTLEAARKRWASYEETIDELELEVDDFTGEQKYTTGQIDEMRGRNMDRYYASMNMGKSAPEGIVEEKSAGKTAQDYLGFLKNKYPNRSDAEINDRVKSKFSDWPGDEVVDTVTTPIKKDQPKSDEPKGIVEKVANQPPVDKPQKMLNPSGVNPNPLDVSASQGAQGIIETMQEALPAAAGKRPLIDSVRDAIKTGDARSLRAMDYNELIKLSNQLNQNERAELGKLLGLVSM